MDAEFWHERWQQGQIGFHQPDFHPALPRYWPRLDLRPGSRVFVPLCGRSLDMVWFAQRFHPVLGVELSPIAAAGFFEHESLTPLRFTHGAFQLYAASNYEILQGDFFDMAPGDAGAIHGWYDRAALIALPPDMRQRYAAHLAGLLAPGARGLLITLEYPPEKMDAPPPFSVPVHEVLALFEQDFTVELLERRDVLAATEPAAARSANSRFLERGLDHLYEAVFRLERR
jgi:thiopurine S-methyltransferase